MKRRNRNAVESICKYNFDKVIEGAIKINFLKLLKNNEKIAYESLLKTIYKKVVTKKMFQSNLRVLKRFWEANNDFFVSKIMVLKGETLAEEFQSDSSNSKSMFNASKTAENIESNIQNILKNSHSSCSNYKVSDLDHKTFTALSSTNQATSSTNLKNNKSPACKVIVNFDGCLHDCSKTSVKKLNSQNFEYNVEYLREQCSSLNEENNKLLNLIAEKDSQNNNTTKKLFNTKKQLFQTKHQCSKLHSKCYKLKEEVSKEVRNQKKLSSSYKSCLEERTKLQSEFFEYKNKVLKNKSALSENNELTLNVDESVLVIDDNHSENIDL